MEIFLFIIAAGVIAHLIGASVHEGIFVGALVCTASSWPFSDDKPDACKIRDITLTEHAGCNRAIFCAVNMLGLLDP